MKKYQFRLTSVLEHRERLEEEAQQNLARVERRLSIEIEKLGVLQHDCEGLTQILRTSHQTLAHDELRMHYARADFLARSIQAAEVTIMNMKMEQEAARSELMKASKDRRMLETLKERRQADHLAETIRLEHASLDDANNRRSQFTLENMRENR